LNDPAYITHLYQTRDQYRSNAETAIVAGEFRKASELLWGSITQELKALAATYGVVISSHRQFFEFLKQLEKELGDRYLYIEFVELNALHKNFYDETIPDDVFPEYYGRSIEYLAHIDSLIRKPNA
jgi:Archaeal PaREP1/PaREP8 family